MKTARPNCWDLDVLHDNRIAQIRKSLLSEGNSLLSEDTKLLLHGYCDNIEIHVVITDLLVNFE